MKDWEFDEIMRRLLWIDLEVCLAIGLLIYLVVRG